jgi:tRNA threonylcarbamoyl adenosine modification protein YeaZ
MLILGVDSSSAQTSLALGTEHELIAHCEHVDARGHAEAIGAMFRETILPALEGRIPDVVVVGVGPGPYSGLRVGIAFAQALAWAWNIPVVGVCSLDALALRVGPREGKFGVASDARRSEIYWATYSAPDRRIAGPEVSRPEDLGQEARSITWFGEGLLSECAQARTDARDVLNLALHAIASGLFTTEPEPLYITELDAHGGAGSSTAQALHGRTILPAQPLYLRHADVTVSPKGTLAHPVAADVEWV